MHEMFVEKENDEEEIELMSIIKEFLFQDILLLMIEAVNEIF
jgi:hypothetical protein